MTDVTRLDESSKPLTRRRQFTLRQVFVITTVLAALMACFVLLDDVEEIAACLLYILFVALLFLLLFRTASGNRVFNRRTILLGVVLSGLHFWMWLWMSEGSGRHNDVIQFLVNYGELLSLPSISMTMALFGVSLWALSPYHTDRLGQWAGRWTLTLLCLYCVPIAAQLMYPEASVRGDDILIFIQYPITLVACIPWVIIWRRRQLRDQPFAVTRWDSAAKWSVLASYALIPLIWLVTVAITIYMNRYVSRTSWDRLGWAVLILMCWVGGHSLAGLIYVFGTFIQWFRDRWQFAVNLPGVLYFGVLWLLCLLNIYGLFGSKF